MDGISTISHSRTKIGQASPVSGRLGNCGIDAQTIKRNPAERIYCLSGSLVYVSVGMRCIMGVCSFFIIGS